MFDLKSYYQSYNELKADDYKEGIENVKELLRTTKGKSDWVFSDYIVTVASFVLKLTELEASVSDEYFESKTFEELKAINDSLYQDIVGENYKASYANPSVCVDKFGDGVGQMLAYVYAQTFTGIRYAYHHRTYDLARLIDLFTGAEGCLKPDGTAGADALKAIIKQTAQDGLKERHELRYLQNLDPKNAYWSDIVKTTDFSDLKYLFKLGIYIGENEIGMAQYISKQPQQKIDDMALTMVDAFFRSFASTGKSLEGKSSVTYYYFPGLERMVKAANKLLMEKGLGVCCNFDRILSSEPNKQFDYDHKFDHALYLDEAYVKTATKAHEEAAKTVVDILKGYAGIIAPEAFGEQQFAPELKKTVLKLSDEQRKQDVALTNNIRTESYKYIDNENWSFVIIAYPLPEIGKDFEAIFDETIKVNTLNSDSYEKIHETLIAALDQGEYAHVKGKGENKTDIMVKLYPLSDPEKETKFENCVAEVNVPVGEVFTSPVLKGTNGVLHVKEIFLGDLNYKDLTLTFKDGFVVEYSCNNFDDDEGNKAYVQDNLMHAHDTLPLGEFAIGTNTTAYVMANKYDIVSRLPILIVEKMGPHFAIGDTCYNWEEDVKIYNRLSGKEMVARENEMSAKRKTNVNEAYTNCHTDITLPYDAIASLSVVKADGTQTDIIRDGRFVLAGTEALNVPLDEMA